MEVIPPRTSVRARLIGMAVKGRAPDKIFPRILGWRGDLFLVFLVSCLLNFTLACQTFPPNDALVPIAQTADAPSYGNSDLLSYEVQGVKVAEMGPSSSIIQKI